MSPPPTKAQVAKATGKSERQIIRDKSIVKDAAKIAKAEGKATPEPQHVSQARIRANEQRKKKTLVPSSSDPLTQLAAKAEKLINAEARRASNAPQAAKGKQSREYLMGRAEGMTEILALINRLRNQR